MAKFDLIVRGGRVIDPASGLDGVHDVAVKDGTIAQVAPRIAGPAARTVDARNQLVIPGMIDTHGHVYQHVTGDFGMNPDEVGIRSGVAAVVDQGGAAPLTIQGFRKFIKDPAATRVYAFVSNYLVGGLLGHRHVGLYGPHGINVKETINAIEKNRDIVKGIKCHAEVGGYSRWGSRRCVGQGSVARDRGAGLRAPRPPLGGRERDGDRSRQRHRRRVTAPRTR